jgi:hypothetical protein
MPEVSSHWKQIIVQMAALNNTIPQADVMLMYFVKEVFDIYNHLCYLLQTDMNVFILILFFLCKRFVTEIVPTFPDLVKPSQLHCHFLLFY